MQLTEHKPGNHHFIRRVDASGVLVDDTLHTSSLVLGARLVVPDWQVNSLGDLDEVAIQSLIEHQPELVLLGIGEHQQFPPAALQQLFFSRTIGLECMTLAAACRTFNVLMSENRRAVAGLILPGR